MRKLLQLLFIICSWRPNPIIAQTLTFAPMDRAEVPQLKDSAVAWTVTAYAPPGSTIPGGRILQVFVQHGGVPIMRELAVDMIHRRQANAPAAVAVKAIAALGAIAAVGATAQQRGDLARSPTAQRIVAWGGSLAAGALVLKPYVEQVAPSTPTAVEPLLLTDRMAVGDAGSATAVFFARKYGDVRPFTETLK